MEAEEKEACRRAFSEGATHHCLLFVRVCGYTFLNAFSPNCQKSNYVKCDGISYLVSQERTDYDRIDQEADEWRAKQIAKDIAKRKVLSRICEICFTIKDILQ